MAINRKITEPDIANSESVDVVMSDQISQKFQQKMNMFRVIGSYAVGVVGIILICIFSYRYCSLLAAYQQIIDQYLLQKDWQIFVIYGLSLLFNTSVLVSLFYGLMILLHSKIKG